MARLVTDPNLPDPDAFYERLVEAHRDLNDAESQRLNARLILLLANQIGDPEALDEALRIARGDPDPVRRTP